MKDQFNELTSPESLREECRSLYAQLQMTQKAQKQAYVRALDDLLAGLSSSNIMAAPPTFDDVREYIDQKKRELSDV